MRKVLLITFLLAACGKTDRPLDADERQLIDSISAAEISALRMQLDSQCQAAFQNELPRMIDSMIEERRKEIEQSLKNVPR